MLNTARKNLLCLAALAALALSAPATAISCYEGKCFGSASSFGIDWKTATPAEVANINVKARDDMGYTPLHIAARHNNNIDVVNALIKKGAEINAKQKHGETPLHGAANTNKNPQIINALVMAGADVNAKDGAGNTPLHFAATSNTNPEVVHALVKRGTNINAKDKAGETPLHRATKWNSNPKVVNALIDGGADVSVKNNAGKTALDLGKKNGLFYQSNAYQALKKAIDKLTNKKNYSDEGEACCSCAYCLA